ncbi:MAG: 16S rRNA (guanine(527)-N(7))-methyltransferase RsmG [Comamonadaceae bacterium]
MGGMEMRLRQGLIDLTLALDDAQIGALLEYLALIQKWTRVYNLTAVHNPAEMLTHHLLDCLAVIAPLRAQLAGGYHSALLDGNVSDAEKIHLLDVGSGAGLPGVVIAICCPDVLVDCVDTVTKKVAFVRQAAAALKRPNLRGVHARVESLSDNYHVISSRAFASLSDFTRLSSGALAKEGFWLAMKGKRPDGEISALPADVGVFHVEQLTVPGLNAERCIVWMRKT